MDRGKGSVVSSRRQPALGASGSSAPLAVSGARQKSRSQSQMRQGPHKCVEMDASDRPLLCVATHGDEVVVGGQDHGLKVYGLATGEARRTLFSRRAGHTDWVTSVDYLADGRILSGGMDSQLCLWKGASAHSLTGHNAGISRVRVDKETSVAFSAGYDKVLLAWDLNSLRGLGALSGHRGPVLDFFWENSLLISTGKDGLCIVYDVNSFQAIQKVDAHRGAATCVGQSHEAFVTGGMDGTVKIWDLRTCSAVTSPHRFPGTVNFVERVGEDRVLVGSAGGGLAILCARTGFSQIEALEGHRGSVFAACVADGLCLSGADNGNVLAHDAVSGECLFGYGANRGGVSALAWNSHAGVAITAGEDGKACAIHL